MDDTSGSQKECEHEPKHWYVHHKKGFPAARWPPTVQDCKTCEWCTPECKV